MYRRFLTPARRKDWMITWKDDKVRWVIFYYLVGLIIACLTTFLEETCFPIHVRYLYKSLYVTVVAPILVVIIWTYWEIRHAR